VRGENTAVMGGAGSAFEWVLVKYRQEVERWRDDLAADLSTSSFWLVEREGN